MAGNAIRPLSRFSQMVRSTKPVRRPGAAGLEIWLRSHAIRFLALTCFAVFALAVAIGMLCVRAQSPTGQAAEAQEKSTSAQAPASRQQDNRQTASAHRDSRRQEIASECADLLKMANDLKTEVDKSTKDMLSVTVVRKADEIEKLAHKVRTGASKN